MQHVLAVVVLSAIASHFHGFGSCENINNMFIYPPDYVKADAPRNNQLGKTLCLMRVLFEIWAINEISLQKQELQVDFKIGIQWVDQRLSMNPNISSQNIWPVMDSEEKKKIWTPTILFRNCKGCSPFSVSKLEKLYVERSTENIFADERILRKFTCAIDLRAYPMDIQFCQIQIYAFEDTEDSLVLEHYYPGNVLNIDSNLTLAQYRITPVIKAKCSYTDPEGLVYSCLELRIRLEHLVTYHLITTFAPTTFIVMLSWISFWLPLELAPARVALGLTTLLTLATRLDQAQKDLPPVAYAKAIDIWMFYCIFLVSSSLCEFAISHYQQELSKKTPKTKARILKVRSIPVKHNNLVRNAFTNEPPASDQSLNYTGSSLDRTSRIVFPLAFLLFNAVYWSFYLTYYN